MKKYESKSVKQIQSKVDKYVQQNLLSLAVLKRPPAKKVVSKCLILG